MVVAGRIEAEQGEPESVLAPGRTVTAAHVAARAGEHRHDVEPEGERRLARRGDDRDRNLPRVPGMLDDEFSVAVGEGAEHDPFHREQFRIGGFQGRRGHVLRAPVGERRLHEHPLPVAGRVEPDPRRVDLDADGRVGPDDGREESKDHRECDHRPHWLG